MVALTSPETTCWAADQARVADVLVAVSNEATIARTKFERLQEIMGDLVTNCPPARQAEAMADVQLVDALAQHLEALSTFVAELARSAESGSLKLGAALDAVTLAEVRSRLTRLCDDPNHPHHPVPVDTGDLDLF
jgi:hypothetical protein